MSLARFAQAVIDQAHCQTGDHGQAFGTTEAIKVVLRHLYAAVMNNDRTTAVDVLVALEGIAEMNEWWDGEYGWHHLTPLFEELREDLAVEMAAYRSLDWRTRASIAQMFDQPILTAVN